MGKCNLSTYYVVYCRSSGSKMEERKLLQSDRSQLTEAETSPLLGFACNGMPSSDYHDRLSTILRGG